MKKTIVLLSILLITNWVESQSVDYDLIKNAIVNLGEVQDGNENFDEFSDLKLILKDVEVVMMGEQSHGEATTYHTKIKLIKYLHQELGFDILAFESGFYDCNKAWQMIEAGEPVRDAMGKSIFYLWATTKDLIPLVDYLEKAKSSNKPLKLVGFDNQLTGKYSEEHFLNDLSDYLNKVKPTIVATNKWKHFAENIHLLKIFAFKELKKNEPEKDLEFMLNLIAEINKTASGAEAKYWIQILKSTHAYLSDASIKTDFRDKQMADNLMWIKEKYPTSKIICWGATSHFLYNSKEVRMKSPFIQILGGLKPHPLKSYSSGLVRESQNRCPSKTVERI